MSPGAERVESFLVPDLGEGLLEVTITAWHVGVGDEVDLNAPLCTVETAKAEVEIPSPYRGRIAEIRGAPGEVLDVGSLLARIAVSGGVDDAPRRGGPEERGGGERRPVLVGYGTDDGLDISRRPMPSRPRAQPAARKLAAELGVDLTTVDPGPAGVITTEAVLDAAAGVEGELVDLGAVQATMAQRMSLAHREIPAASATVEVDGTRLLQLRDGIDDPDITVFALTVRLTVMALARHQSLNATWAADSRGAAGPRVRYHRGVHLGFAAATSRGLLVPVIRDAEQRGTRDLAAEIARLTDGARRGTLGRAELRGSTFTVTNFGALGVDEGVPIINPPEAAILGMGSLRPRPAVRDGTLVIAPLMTLTCVFDHRILDGAQVAAFLTDLRGLIEDPASAVADL
ncbi:2-oxo acid dehydrogenase subunit E2 [Mycobacterium koreense]|uniref:Dihydrolipoamide acetyltransferase component of pyruvate dehydrogenase complex n=1 Tax=Mycolicibacillus koreensis TaxID=1069220 RepID=A0A7I7S938_9MYCO|nr:dihydrolipoamide acetyltransferase family protein [Mycolicibacillus koreensis]MCV7247831.1 2-oxo acid dehydrogenase subunit E2 [Mycolicibacillus koreensis]OSC33053.1 branched-chain alpha-keto acid dehydrogenase subunit E2 [Mycolicibacillus koreensis]BBY53030.1 dihydrolipoyllysine-residue acyltransferase component of branched-chain alpha-ketoacid dehydrogenase complex [Mycolicibacillus koreensis]